MPVSPARREAEDSRAACRWPYKGSALSRGLGEEVAEDLTGMSALALRATNAARVVFLNVLNPIEALSALDALILVCGHRLAPDNPYDTGSR